MTTITTDEATVDDRLDRGAVVDALATVAQTCQTPFVIGVYGHWGSGKTSLLRMVKDRLPSNGPQAIWFDAWLHQDDENPAIALLQTMVSQFGLGDEGKKILTVIAGAFSGALMKITSGISVKDVRAWGEAYENERFQQRDARIRLREYFAQLVSKARGADDRRIVFFIDDIDRCQPDAALRILEALRLYLNIPGCIYILATDKDALLQAIAQRYGSGGTATAQYLDKVIQLPLHIPFPPPSRLRAFTERLLPPDLQVGLDFIDAGIGGNPRSIKRFVNVLVLCHTLARARQITPYDPAMLCFILLLQYRDYDRFLIATGEPRAIAAMVKDMKTEKSPFLKAAMRHLKQVPSNIADYIHLTDSAGVATALDDADPEGEEIVPTPDSALPISRPARTRTKGAVSASPAPLPMITHTRKKAPTKTPRKPNAAFMKPVTPDPDLAAIVGSRSMPRTELTKKLWAYIKKNGLQDRKNFRLVNADSSLKKVFGGKSQVSMFDMTKLVSKHVS